MPQIAQPPVVLLAESDAIIGMDLSDALERAGYRVLEPVGTTAEALHLMEREKPTLAVIDAVLQDGRATELTKALRRDGVLFLVHSASQPDRRTDGEFQGVTWLSKPAVPDDVVVCLNELAASAIGRKSVASTSEPKAEGNPLIRKLERFAFLSDADRAALDHISAKPRHVAAGIDLVREGDAPAGVFLVMDGMACRHKLRATGTRQIMAYLVPGDLCDLDVALLSTMDHTITTLSASSVICLAPETVADLLTNHPQIARALRKAQLVDEATLREWLVNVGRRAAPERLAHLLCEMLLRLQVVDRASENAYALPLTQVELADTVGLTPVHVNRTLRELRQKRLIELSKGHVTILDWPRLRAMAEFRPNYLHLADQAAA